MAEQPKYVTTADGRRITYTRWKYEETQRQQATIAQVNDLITSQATTLANVGANMAQQEYGGYLRTIIPNLLDSYGNVNAQAAINYYEQSRKEWFNAYGSEASRQVTRSSVAAREKRFAAAKTQGAYRVGTMTAEDFAAQFLPTYKTLEKSEAVIGFAMKVRAKSGHEPSVSAMNNALTREVASYHRDTVLFNSALDPFVSRVQRVAQATACEFCKLMALGSTSGKVRVSSYAVKFHSHCHCTIQTLWEGEDPIRPDYYDDFEQEYIDAAGEGRSAKETLEQWRKNTKAKAPMPPVEVQTRKINPDAPEFWGWQKEAQNLSNEERQKLFGLDRKIPLAEARQNLPLLSQPDTLENAAIVTNPKFAGKELGYSTNCVRVTNAYELRRRGYDVTASPKLRTNDLAQNPFFFEQGWKDAAGNDLTLSTIQIRRNRKRGTLTDNTIQTILDNHPEGSRGWVHFDWERGGAGHIVNWEVQNNKVVFVDAQSGDIDGKVLDYFPRAKNLRMVRLDDKTPQAWVLQYLEGFNE